jgi:hypothetical protein
MKKVNFKIVNDISPPFIYLFFYQNKLSKMKKSILLILLFSTTLGINAQTKSVNTIGISVPIIWNNSEGVYYGLGTRREPEGKSKSIGLNINYNRTIYKNIFGIIGIGYFKQNFKIARPFNFDDPATNLLYSTQSYSYSSLQFDIGLGGIINLNSKFNMMPKIKYSHLNTFKQKYIVYKDLGTEQTNKVNFSLGNILQSSLEFNYNISNKFSLGVGFVIPVSVKWKKDNIFFKYDYSDDSQIIAYNKSSIGSLITINYNLK